MYKQILAKLVALHPGLSKAVLGLIATQLATSVTEESGIDAAITAFDNTLPITTFASEFQKEGDRRVAEATKPKPADPKPEPGKDPAPKGDDTPAWAKALMDKVDRLEKEKTQGGMTATLAERLKGKVPASYYGKRALPEKPEDLDAFVAEIEADYTAFKQELANQGFQQAEPPMGGEQGSDKGGSTGPDKSIMAEIDKHVARTTPPKKPA